MKVLLEMFKNEEEELQSVRTNCVLKTIGYKWRREIGLKLEEEVGLRELFKAKYNYMDT